MSVTQVPGTQVLNGTLTDADVAAANKDGLASTPSMRTLGTGPLQAAAGDDSRFGAGGGGPPSGFALTGGYINASVAGNALTISVKTMSGADPSAGSPVHCQFRDATLSNPVLTSISLVAATSLTINSGATLGVTAVLPFRIWIIGINDGGTFRLGAIVCTKNNNGLDYAAYPLRDYMLKTTVAVSGSANAARTIYANAVATTKPIRVLGWLEYSSGLATPGVWNAGPTIINQQMPGDPLPGDVVQRAEPTIDSVMTFGVSNIAANDNIPLFSMGKEYLSNTMTPISSANMLRVLLNGYLSAPASEAMVMALFRDPTDGNSPAIRVTFYNMPATLTIQMLIDHWVIAGSITPTTFKMRAGGHTGAGNTTYNGHAAARYYGGTVKSVLAVEEIMS